MVSVSTSLMRYGLFAGARANVAIASERPPGNAAQPRIPAAESASERARARLNEIKERLETMERMGFPAEVVARLAATLNADATRSAGQIGTGPSEGTGAPTGTAGTSAQAIPSDGAPQVEADPTRETDALPPAYRDVIENRSGAASSDDAAIRREFETLAARIRALQQRAAREATLLAR